jgi:aryl-alcohol dehydrogenase-like predicted oxidoreductase
MTTVETETIQLGTGLRVSRIAKGNWQLAERHSAPYDRDRAIEDMRAFVEAGITLFDCADHYVGVEQLIGDFRRRHPGLAAKLRVSTKLVPDQGTLRQVKRADLEKIVDTSLVRLGLERLDLVQFHWWDYAVPGYVQCMQWMKELQAAGKVAHLGTTNFDCKHLAEIVDSGVTVATNQLQYSVLDRRPERGMVQLCARHDIKLLCYGVLGGGFVSSRWLGALPPKPPYANRSLQKYHLIIEDFGGWARFQELLRLLDRIGKLTGVSLSSVATRYILDKPGVAVAILGARSAAHLEGAVEVLRCKLEPDDRAAIAALADSAPGPTGDCYDLERLEGGVHSSIMWKNQNTQGAGAR